MNTLAAGLVVVGCVIFFAASSLFYYRLFRVSPKWAIGSMLFPPAALVSVAAYFRRHPMSAAALVASTYLLIVATVLYVRVNPLHPALEVFPFVRNGLAPAAMGVPRYEKAFPDIGDAFNSTFVTGVLQDKERRWTLTEWDGNTLRFADSNEAIPSALIQIHLDGEWQLTEDNRQISIAPTQINPPVIELFSADPIVSGAPHIKVLKSGYWLELSIDNMENNRLSGNINLKLPSQYNTWLAGGFSAYTDGMRYINDEIDRQHDSADTLARIAASHVSAHLWKWLQGQPVAGHVKYQTSFIPFNGRAVVTANLGQWGNFELPVAFEKGEGGWYVVPDAVPLLAVNLEMERAPAAAGQGERVSPPSAQPDSLHVIERFSRLTEHLGQTGEVYTFDGRKLIGELLSADETQLKLRRKLGRNEIAVTVSANNFVKFVPAPDH